MPTRASIAGLAARPDVIVDFNCAQGMLFITLKNIGARSAYAVTTTFDKPLYGLEGKKCISELQLFRRAEFVPPGKEFAQLMGPIAGWFKQRRSAKVNITITYRDREGNRFNERITHDLRIYRDLGYTRTSRSGGIDGSSAG